MADPLAEMRSWTSPYQYAQNNPIGRIDPDGMLDDRWDYNTATNTRTWVSDEGRETNTDYYYVHNGKSMAEVDYEGKEFVVQGPAPEVKSDYPQGGGVESVPFFFEALTLGTGTAVKQSAKALIKYSSKSATKKTIEYGANAGMQFRRVKKYAKLEGYTDVVSHGSSIKSAETLSSFLTKEGVTGNIRLVACGGAKHAQNLATLRKVTVLASKSSISPSKKYGFEFYKMTKYTDGSQTVLRNTEGFKPYFP